MANRGALADFVDDLQVGGRLTFTRAEALAALGISPEALKQAVLRLAAKGRLVSPRRGFYVIVPLEHRLIGAPPIEKWLPELMRFQGTWGEIIRREDDGRGGGAVEVRAGRFLRPLTCGPWLLKFAVKGGDPPDRG